MSSAMYKETIMTKMQALVEEANEWLSRPDLSDEEKAIIFSFTESILHKHKAYRGFNYRYWIEKGFDVWIKDGEPQENKDAYIYGSYSKYDRVFYS